ncbi:E3 ubiquitin-protein ligase rnf168 [Heterodontus francisci]|uniref:E3 ubiquitin-protein ligase rnf168 n=1 Tax=Heterodontus francisci TaxID=7792 RepID=UPI00355B18E3
MGRKRQSGFAEPKAPALSLAECLCPVCQELLAEPVTPPCGHSLCLSCFQQTVAISNLNCPLCRRRLSNWARTKARGGNLVNTELQEQIRQQFPQHRSEEPRDGEVDRLCPRPQLCKPGEVRQEYEEQISKLKAERHAREEEELRASEDFIQKLLAEEQQQQRLYEEQQRKEMDEQLKRDEKLAKMLSKEMNSISKTPPESLNSHTRRVSSKSNSSSVTRGIKLTAHNHSHTEDIQRYLSPTSQKYQIAETCRWRSDASATESKSTDADDIISNTDSFASICPFHCEEEQEPVCSSAHSELVQCIEGTPTAASTDHQQMGEYTGEHGPGDNENEMAGICSSVWKGKERCKEDVPLAELKINSINSNEDDLLDSAVVPILGDKLDYAHTSASHCDLNSIVCATVHCDEDIALKQKPSQDQGTKHQVVNQTPIKLKKLVKRKTWNSSEVEGETCSTFKKRKVCPNVYNEPSESIQPSHRIFQEDQLSDWEKKQSERLRMEEQDRLLALRIQKKLDREMLIVNRKRGSPDEYLLRTNKLPATNCEKRLFAKNQKQSATQKGSQTSGKLQRSQSRCSALGKKQTGSSPATSRRKNRNWQHPASQVKSHRTLCQGPLNCMDANSAALIPVNELRNSKKQQTIVEMFQKHSTN